MLKNGNPNKNETDGHYELKQVAKYLAKWKGCQMVADEVGGFRDMALFPDKGGVVDVAGIKVDCGQLTSYGFEVKVTLGDFRNGYNTGADYTYIVAPKGIIPPAEIPKGIGLYEVDLNDYSITYQHAIYGIKTVKKASRRDHPERQNLCNNQTRLDLIARRLTNIMLYAHCEIIIEEAFK